MRLLPRLHLPTVRGRLRADRGLLLLAGLVVALTCALTAAVSPVTEQTADRAVAASVRDAGLRGAVVATVEPWYDDPRSEERETSTAGEVSGDADYARYTLPPVLADILEPGISSVTTSLLELRDAGPGRYLQLAYLDTADGGPSVSYVTGGPPRATRPQAARPDGTPAEDGTWPVQVALAVPVARALDLEVGDLAPGRDEQGRAATVQVSGTFEPTDPDDDVWRLEPGLLAATTGTTEGVQRTSAVALVTARSLPDLRYALPGEALSHRVTFLPEPSRLRWQRLTSIEQAVASLQAGGGDARAAGSWDSLLGTVLDDVGRQVGSARGQAQVLVVGLLVCAVLVLVLAAQLLVRRRTGSLTMARERGAGLLGVAGELAAESLLVALAGAAAGLGVTRLLAGSAGWGWSLPVVVVAVATSPWLGATVAARTADPRRVAANRSARRTAAQALALRRVAWEVGVLGCAVLTFVALRQRGVVGAGDEAGPDLTASTAVTWGALAGAVVLLRLMPPALRWVLRRARRATGGVSLAVAARLTGTGANAGVRVLPVLLVCTAVAQVGFGVALVATTREGQDTSALASVGGDARLDTRPDPALTAAARQVAEAPGVRAATAARVEDLVRVSASGGADFVRLVVVDAPGLERLLASSDLPDAPRLSRLRGDGDGPVPVLLRGGADGLRDEPHLRWGDDSVPLEVVGTAPDVEGSADPVLVVDVEALAAAGVVAPPDTLWAVGPGAADALEAVAPDVSDPAPVVSLAEELDRRRGAALPSAVVALAAASSVLLVLLALLGTVLAAAADAPGRGVAIGRLRALGLADRDLRRVLAGEVLVPVAVASVAGLALGVGCAWAAMGSLSLRTLTGAPDAPALVVPWWTVLPPIAPVACALVVVAVEWRRARRTSLARLLRE